MTSIEREPVVYQAEHVREHLLGDPLIGELDLHVAIDGRRVVVTGHVSTRERHDAITVALAHLLPDHDVRNETTVTDYPEAPGRK